MSDSTNAAVTAAANERRSVFIGKMELTSSKLNKMPPKGAPKAVLTPAAAAAEINSRRRLSSENCSKVPDKSCAQHTATWTKGPSLPRDIPAATERARPGILTTSVRKETTSGITKPPRIVFTSGIPEPAAALAKQKTKVALAVAINVPSPTFIKKPLLPVPQACQESMLQLLSLANGVSEHQPNRVEERAFTNTSMKPPEREEHAPIARAKIQPCICSHQTCRFFIGWRVSAV
mmetsp:Transcript_23671/g.51771  ORF Transcript_23671/g.51771 Transcript_23671/m.51771 type:complete len:234 (+) Transcript_23671:1497-2198(+)